MTSPAKGMGMMVRGMCGLAPRRARLLQRAGVFALAIGIGSVLALAPTLSASPPRNSVIPTPDDFAGFPIGSDGNLVRWEKIVSYFELVGGGSDRVLVEELGKSTNGNPFLLATISSAENLARLGEIKSNQWKIAHPGDLDDDEISDLAWNSPAVVMITCSIHATEIGASQMVLELVHRLATEQSPWIRNVLDNVVFLLVPSFNPDGQIIVTDWNNRVRDSENVWSPIPWLYHPYVGHDNNRDAFMMTQVESRYVNKILFQDWFPQIYLDQHQQGNSGMRVFVPPFRNPINPNVDPVIWSEIGLTGFAMFTALHEAGYTGVAYDQGYTAWWQGGFLRGAWFHNMVGLLTEVASANLASPVFQRRAEPGKPPDDSPSRSDWEKARLRNPRAPMPAPRDVIPRNNYPRPWLGGKWTLRDIIDYELTLTYALLEAAANNRVRLITNQIRMGQRAIEEGKTGNPIAYVFPERQHDPGALARLLEALHYTGIEVHRAGIEFKAGGESYPPGTYVIPMAQPFRAYAKDLLEPQNHPDPGDLPTGAMSEQPYDVTAWTLPLQMGVRAVPVQAPFDAQLARLDAIPSPKGKFTRHGSGAHGYLIRAEPNAKTTATNRLLRAGAEVSWVAADADATPGRYPAGTIHVKGVDAVRMESLSDELGLQAEELQAPLSAETIRLREPRVAIYQPWTASMDEGWTRWLLQKYEFRATTLHDADIRAGRLSEYWDAIILPGDRGNKSIVEGHASTAVPAEYRGGIGDRGRQALRAFVSEGGTLITMGGSTEFALLSFELPLQNALKDLKRPEFSCPGSLLRILVDNRHPIAYGMASEGTASFSDDAAFASAPGFSYTDLKVIARYPADNPLQSGWLRGPEHLQNRIAAAEVLYRKGRVVLIGFRPQFRAQPDNTFKLLFNAIHYSAAR